MPSTETSYRRVLPYHHHRPILIILSVFFVAVVGFSLISSPVAASGVTVWRPTASYPTNIHSQSCVLYGGYIYCVGGNTGNGFLSSVYFAPLLPSGAGEWKSTTDYSTTINGQSCVAMYGFIYCVGGFTGSSFVNSVYFAPLLASGGVGEWKPTANYPASVANLSCVASGGYIYCAGGYTGSGFVSSVYFARVSNLGIGSWTQTTSYPTVINAQSCVVNSGMIFCVGGYSTSLLSAVYFAPLVPSGVGEWMPTANYATSIEFQSCLVVAGVVVCVGGNTDTESGATTSAVYYAFAGRSGLGSWKPTAVYPTNTAMESCVWDIGPRIYCIGGTTNTVSGSGTTAVYFGSG